MDLGPSVDQLELALIELEYAKADFACHKTSTSDRGELARIDCILEKLAVADIALQIATDVLTRLPEIADVEHPIL
jgi:hypothetical protein